MPEIDLTPLRPVLAEFGPQGRPALLPALHAAQKLYGYLPEPVAHAVGHALGVPLSDVYGVIDFYSMFYREPVGRRLVRVCADPACALAGSDAVLAAACARAGVKPGEVSAGGALTVESVPCLGLCEHAPAVLVDDTAQGRVQPDQMDALFDAALPQPAGIVGGDLRVLTANCGRGRVTPPLVFPYAVGVGMGAADGVLKLLDVFELPAHAQPSPPAAWRGHRTSRLRDRRRRRHGPLRRVLQSALILHAVSSDQSSSST